MAPQYARYLDRLRRGEPVRNPFLSTVGVTLVEINEQECVMAMECRPEYVQSAGALQGGMIVALADEAIAHAAMATLADDEDVTTVQLNMNFLGPAVVGDRLLARATLVKRGRSLIVGEALVTNQEEKLIGRCSATFMVLRPAR